MLSHRWEFSWFVTFGFVFCVVWPPPAPTPTPRANHGRQRWLTVRVWAPAAIARNFNALFLLVSGSPVYVCEGRESTEGEFAFAFWKKSRFCWTHLDQDLLTQDLLTLEPALQLPPLIWGAIPTLSFWVFVNLGIHLEPRGLSFVKVLACFGFLPKLLDDPHPPRISSPLPRSSEPCADVLSDQHVNYMFDTCFYPAVFNEPFSPAALRRWLTGPPPYWFSGRIDAVAPPHRLILVEIVSHYHPYRLLLLPSSLSSSLLCSLFSVWIWHSAYPKPQDAPPHHPQTHEHRSNHSSHTHTPCFSAYFGTFHLFCHKHFLLTDCNKSLCDLKDFKQFLPGEVGNIHHLREKKKKKKYRIKSVLYRNIFLWWDYL